MRQGIQDQEKEFQLLVEDPDLHTSWWWTGMRYSDEHISEDEEGTDYSEEEDAPKVIEYEYMVTAKGDLRGVILYTTLGGPAIWLDTHRRKVIGLHSNLTAESPVTREMCDRVNDYWLEYFQEDKRQWGQA